MVVSLFLLDGRSISYFPVGKYGYIWN